MVSILLLSAAPVLYGATTPDFEKWQTAGDPSLVRRDGQRATLTAEEPATAGLLSPAKAHPPGTTALLVSADVSVAEVRAVTISVHAAGGATTGYWQNSMPVSSGRASAVLPTTRPAGPLRVFVGTHGHPSSASIENVRIEPVRRGMSFRGAQYGAVVHSASPEGQSFKSQGKRLAAIRVLVRRMKADDGPDLRVRVYPLSRDGAPDRAQPPLAEAIVPRQQIPPADGRREELTVPLAAETLPGRKYFVEFSTTAPCAADSGFLLWGGIWGGSGNYADGCRYQNGSAVKDWDLHLETYEGF
jgi:hypothetical protein